MPSLVYNIVKFPKSIIFHIVNTEHKYFLWACLERLWKKTFIFIFSSKKWELLLPFAYIFIIAANFELLSFSYEGRFY